MAPWLATEHGPIDIIIHSHFFSGAAAVAFCHAWLGIPFPHTDSSLLARKAPKRCKPPFSPQAGTAGAHQFPY